MAEILPFRALHFNPVKAPALGLVATQPYDKISLEMQESYYARSPLNFVRLVRGRREAGDQPGNDVYTRAASEFQQWIQDRVLIAEATPAIYPYDQEYCAPGSDGPLRRRPGFIALGRLEDYSAGVVHRHEETLDGPKADRLALLRATRAHLEQILVLYSDPEGHVEAAFASETRERPWQQVKDEYGTVHSVWRLAEPAAIARVVEAMRPKKLVIADGHHRYETALAFRDECRRRHGHDPRADYVMMTFVRMEGDGLTILPTHRLVRDLAEFDWGRTLEAAQSNFEWRALRKDGDWHGRFLGTLGELGRERTAVGVYAGGNRAGWMTLRPEANLRGLLPDVPEVLARLDVIVLHRLLFENLLGISREAVREEKNLAYVREPERAFEAVDAGRAAVAFLLNPTKIRDVWENALAGRVLPQKSTDFYPKLLSGLTIYWPDNPAGI